MSQKKPESMFMDRCSTVNANPVRVTGICIMFVLAFLVGMNSANRLEALQSTTPGGNSSNQNPPAKPGQSQSASDLANLDTKRICVSTLGGDDRIAGQVQSMLISSLFAAKRFRITENCDRADLILKGTAAENKERLTRYEDEGVGFGKSAGAVSGSFNSSGGSVSGGAASVAGAQGETLASTSEKTNAALALRLVNKDGEIIWATTEESTGNKIKGPAADLADRAVRNLIREIDKPTKSPQAMPL